MFYRAGHTGFPMLGIRSKTLSSSVGVNKFQNAPEGAFLSYESIPAVIVRGNDLVGPPAGSYLGAEFVYIAGSFLERRRDVISKSILGFGIVRKAGLQNFLSHQFPVQVNVKNAKGRCHPDSLLHFSGVGDAAKEP